MGNDKSGKLATLLLIFAVAIPASLASGQSSEKEESGSGHEGHMKHQGAITYTGDGTERSTTVLGGALGSQSVSDVTVGLFVLQADSPERLKEGGSGPTHVFNVTFTDEKTEELLKQAQGTIVVTGADGSQQSEAIQPFRKHFQARFRLEHPGDYLIQVAFESGDRKGTTQTYAFNYVRKAAATQSEEGEDEHAHH
jgi:hypothetical protein